MVLRGTDLVEQLGNKSGGAGAAVYLCQKSPSNLFHPSLVFPGGTTQGCPVQRPGWLCSSTWVGSIINIHNIHRGCRAPSVPKCKDVLSSDTHFARFGRYIGVF